MATQQQQPPAAAAPWPFYDLFLDVPHPAASPHTPPSKVIGAPPSDHHESIEQELSKSMPQIARFAFPEYDQDANPPPPPPDQAAPVNRFDQYAMQPPAFQNYTFSLTLQSGMRVHGHVRRYLPCHVGAKSRYDVGRRGERALVILTRVTGADLIYSAVLKTVDAISSHQLASPHHVSQKEPQQIFLHHLFQRHQQIWQHFANKQGDVRKKPVFLTLPDLEVGQDGAKKYAMVDTTHFLLTPPLLIRTSDMVSNTASSSILPVLRCLGVAHTLRLLCALLSERRVILISASPTRLATCCKSATAMLAQGMLQWQHLYIPVLPPHLWQYLAAPYPYLIGILASLTPRLDRTDGLGEVLIINLDQNNMETRNIPTSEIQQRIPDLLRNMNAQDFPMQLATGAAPASSPELLAQDLVELLKNDKRTLNGESALASMQDTAVKATKAVKATFFNLKKKGTKFLKQQSGNFDTEKEEEEEPSEPEEVNPMAPDYIYTEGCRNEMGEEEARLAFTTFFVSMVGNMRWYLSAQPGKPPQLDRQRFLQQKRANGEGEHSTMWPLLQNFCQTQMLEEFAKMRVKEMQFRQPITADSPLFLQCSSYHHTHKTDFSLLSVRRVARQVQGTNPSRMMAQTNARRMAMELTSKRAFEGDYNKALADLVEQCRESSSVLFDVMSVVWIRMRDNRGLQWRHAVLSLHILKNLLFHGPLAAVAETTDGLDKIRALKYYNGNRQAAICTQIRQSAAQVYSLVVDRSKLYQIRRVCINKRRALKRQDQGRLRRDTRLAKGISIPFQKVHAAMNPNAPRTPAPRTPPPSGGAPAYNATPTIVALPPKPAQHPPQSAPPPAAQVDLLGLTQPVQPQAQAAASQDVFGMFGGGAPTAPAPAAPPAPANDMLGLFGAMTVGGPQQPGAPPGQYPPQQPGAPPGGQYAPQQPPVSGGYAPQQHDPFAGALVAQVPQPQQHQYAQPQQVRSQSTSPVPPQGRSLSPTPFGQQQQQPPPPQQQPYGAAPPMQQHAMVPSQQPQHQYGMPPQQQQQAQRALSPTPPANRALSPPRGGYGQAPAYNAQTPAFAQPPSDGSMAFASPPPQAPASYGAAPPQAPGSYGAAQGFQQQAPPPNAYGGYPPQQQQQPPPPHGAYGQAPPPQQQQQQQGPFF